MKKQIISVTFSLVSLLVACGTDPDAAKPTVTRGAFETGDGYTESDEDCVDAEADPTLGSPESPDPLEGAEVDTNTESGITLLADPPKLPKCKTPKPPTWCFVLSDDVSCANATPWGSAHFGGGVCCPYGSVTPNGGVRCRFARDVSDCGWKKP